MSEESKTPLTNAIKRPSYGMDGSVKDELHAEVKLLRDHAEKLELANAELRKAPVLSWVKGPAEGGEGTAGNDANGVPQWWDGDRLMIIIETNQGREMAIVDICADEDSFSVTDASSGNEYDAWGPDSWSWYAKLSSKNLPPALASETKGEGL